ncbi:MAG: pyridoxamine 5'-phosphate oxidase family protein [Chloroflexota bacterium]
MEPAHPSPTVASVLTPRQRAFLDQPLFAALATTDDDGAPRQAVIWYRLEADGRILLNSRIGRRWPSNLLRDGRVSLAVTDPASGYSWLGLSGRVDEVIDEHDAALAGILALNDRYHPEGGDPEDLASFHAYPRITFLVAVDRVHDHLED